MADDFERGDVAGDEADDGGGLGFLSELLLDLLDAFAEALQGSALVHEGEELGLEALFQKRLSDDRQVRGIP